MDAENLPLPNSAQEPTFLHYCEIYFCEAWYWRKRDVPMPTCCSTRVLHSRYLTGLPRRLGGASPDLNVWEVERDALNIE